MTWRGHERLTELFLQASTLRSEQRSAFLDRACGGEAELRSELESLLRHGSDTPTLLQRGVVAAGVPEEIIPPPDRIGCYRIREKIGAGGMGVVYRAEQEEPIRRQVALKLIKLGFETEQVIARFNSERQVLALMDHPNIARVLDAGVTPQGRPYFAMEYVSGEPITSFCDRHRLSVVERLALFLQVCDAVHHAHQNSIIHRDIKPSNVLVTSANGEPVPKIIDFGIAKALAREAGNGAALTEAGQLIGTPEYMSPEQATSLVRNIDIRADVYSLGALLYELLVGSSPFDAELLQSRDAEEIRRWLLEEEAPKPSVRVSAAGEAATAVAAARRTSLPSLVRRLRGDLDCIVMKALSKERARRYGSASDLTADVRRYLDHDPIEARPASAVYRVGRFARKHRTVVSVVGALIPILLAAAIVMTFQAQQTARERDRAEELSEFLIGFYDAPFFVAERHRRPDADDMLARSAARIESELSGRPLLQARLSHAVGTALRNVGDFEQGVPFLEGAREHLAHLLGPENPRTLAASNDLARAYRESGNVEQAEQVFMQVLAGRRRVLGDAHVDSLRTMSDLAYLYKSTGRNGEAAPLFAEALGGMRAGLGDDHAETTTTAGLLASVYLDLRRLEEAEALLADTLPRMADDHPERAIVLYNRACVHALAGRRREALHWLRRASEAGFRIPFWTDANVKPLHNDPEFVSIAKRALLQDPMVLERLQEQGKSHIDEGQFESAEALLRFVIEETPAPFQPALLRFHGMLVQLFMRQRRYEDARREMELLLDLRRQAFGADHDNVATDHFILMQTHLGTGDRQNALAELEVSMEIFSRGPTSPYRRAWIPYLQADREALRGDQNAALRHLQEAVELGYPHLAILREDLALQGLHGTREFEEVLARLSERYDYP